MPPFLLGESHGHAGVGMARIFGLCFALLFASSVVNAATIDVGPSDYKNFGPSATHTAGGVRSTFGQQVRLPPTISGPTRLLPVSRNAVIPYGSIVNGAKNLVRINPGSVAVSAAITGLFLAVDWVFDQASGEWVIIRDEVIESPELGLWSVHGASFPTPEAACEYGVPRSHGSFRYDNHALSGNVGICYGAQISNPSNVAPIVNIERTSDCPSESVYDSSAGVCVIEGQWKNLDDSDWSQLEGTLPSLPAQNVADAASDIQRRQGAPLPGYQDLPMTGPSSVSGPSSTSTSTDPVTGESTVTTTSTQTDISYGDETITTTSTTTSTSYQNGQETGTTVTTETPGDLPVETGGGGASGDWPGFCSWATVVCDWLNWTREDPPPEEDLPVVIDDDFFEQKNISFGSKSCPPPHEVNLAPFLETTVGVSFQPLCDFAGLIYYMVMAASYIIAAYISIGVARA